MKTAQAVSGLLLGVSLLIPLTSANAFIVLDDGGVHIINSADYRLEWIEVRNGTTLRLEAGAEVGGEFNQSGTILIYDTSTLVLAGGRIGGDGDSSGAVYVYDSGRFIVEGGVLGGAGYGAGQAITFNQASLLVTGGELGADGPLSGLVGMFDTCYGQIHGGTFRDNGAYSGLVIAFGESLAEVYLESASLPFGVVADLSASIQGTWKDGSAASLKLMREPAAQIVLVEDTGGGDDGGGGDTDGDGVPDDADSCPDSDLRATVWIRDIDTGVANQIEGNLVNAAGCSLADLVAEVVNATAAAAANHGQFVSEMASGLDALQRAGVFPRQVFGRLQNAAARCGWEADAESP